MRARGLDVVSSRWATVLASDSHIRYCRSCLSEGYQSIFCQIDGLLECPIHREPLYSVCHACGAPTARYALTYLSMAVPFKCPLCQSFYGDRPFSILAGNHSSQDNSYFEPYAALFRWLLQIGSPLVSWPTLRDWHWGDDRALLQGERSRAIFCILTRLHPIEVKGSLAVDHSRIALHVHRVPPAEVSVIALPNSDDSGNERVRRTHLFRSLRRHLMRSLLRRHRRCVAGALERLTINWDSLEMYPTSEICPLAFGFLLWRHHFEEPDLLREPHRGLCLRTSVLNWPGQTGVTTKAWGSFASMSFAACFQVAIEWATESAALADLDEKAREVRFRELVGMFRVKLSPRILAWPSLVTCIRLADEACREQVLAVVRMHSRPDGNENCCAQWTSLGFLAK